MLKRVSNPMTSTHSYAEKQLNWFVQQQQQPIRNEVVTSTSKVVAKWESQSGTRDGTRDVRGCTTGTEIA